MSVMLGIDATEVRGLAGWTWRQNSGVCWSRASRGSEGVEQVGAGSIN